MKNLLFVFFLTFNVHAQNQLDKYQVEDLRQNIICYSIRYSEIDNYKNFYPEPGWELYLKIVPVKCDINFDNENMIFYEVINENFSFQQINGIMFKQKTFTHDIPLYFKLSRLSLIAINDKNEILYLGGNFYKTSIANKFNLSITNSSSFSDFLRIKLYNYKIDNFIIIKRNKKSLFFKGFSNLLLRDITVIVDRSNFDNIIIETD